MEIAATSPGCAECKGRGVRFHADREFARAEVCTCQASCKLCGGSGRTYVMRDGYEFLSPCTCQSLRRGVLLYNQAQLPAVLAGKDFESIKPHFRELEGVVSTVREFCTTFVPGKSAQGYLIGGPVGTAKTHLLAATLGYLTLEAHVPCRYVEVSFLYSEIRRGFGEGKSSLDIIAPLADVPVLAIDELGKGKMSPFEQETIDELISRRYNASRCTLFATNYVLHAPAKRAGFTSTHDRLADAKSELSLQDRVGERVFSRLHQMCKLFELPPTARDYRQLTALR